MGKEPAGWFYVGSKHPVRSLERGVNSTPPETPENRGIFNGPRVQQCAGEAPAIRARQGSGLGSNQGPLRLPDKLHPGHRISRGTGIFPTAPEPEHSRARLART